MSSNSAFQGIFAPKNQIAVPKSTYKLKFLRQKLHKHPLFDVKNAHFSKSAFIRLQITIFSNSALDQSANILQYFCILNSMKERIQKIYQDVLVYLKSLNWIVLLGIAAFSIALAIINNIRVDDAKSVDWIGSQEILENPADIL